jgi:hypothetical protein
MAFYSIHPFGSERDNIHAAQIASTIANANRGKNQPAFTANDFMLKTQEQKRKENTNSVLAFLSAHAVKK